MKKIMALSFAAVCCVALAQTAMAEIVFSSPGHVLAESETATVSGGTPLAPYELTDWLGNKVTAGAWDAKGGIVLKNMRAGYYHVKTGGDDITFAVVPDMSNRTFDRNSFYGVDSAQSWVSRKGRFLCPWYDGDTYRLVGDLIWRAGIPHVRDRLSWNEVSKKPEEYDFGHYLYNADLLHERKIGISGMFHDTASYVKKMQKLPADLKALHEFCRKTAATFGNRMEDWEFWNEIDVSAYAPEPVWDYAATMKAAYLGFKDGAAEAGYPELLVLPGSLCIAARSVYDEGLFANDLAKYSDVFNFHTYAPIAQYPGIFADLRAFLKRNAGAAPLAPHAKVLADAMEAVMGAVWLDGGLEAARAMFDCLNLPIDEQLNEWGTNPKGHLQVMAQAMRPSRKPLYTVDSVKGPPHAPIVTVTVEVSGLGKATATAGSQRLAECAAATALLTDLKARKDAAKPADEARGNVPR